jgi:hypothetical protein
MTQCRIYLCDWTHDGADSDYDAAFLAHRAADHPTAEAAQQGLARWSRTLSESRGREPSTAPARPEAPRVHDATLSPGLLFGQSGSRPRRFCVYCGSEPETNAVTCAACAPYETAYLALAEGAA